jgi:hypothetical protein
MLLRAVIGQDVECDEGLRRIFGQDLLAGVVRLTDFMLEKAGADYVVDSLAELPEVIEDIKARLAGGEKP